MARFSGWQVARITCASGILAVAAAFVFVLASVTWTGCVIDCNATGGKVLGAAALGLLSFALLVAGPLASWRMFGSRAAAVLASSAVAITLLSAFACILLFAAFH